MVIPIIFDEYLQQYYFVKIFLSFIFSIFILNQLAAQPDFTAVSVDSVSLEEDSISLAIQDSLNEILRQEQTTNDSLKFIEAINFTSKMFDWAHKKSNIIFDIQQKRIVESNMGVFIVIMLLLILFTYLKLAYSNDLEELVYAVSDTNRALQIYRTQTDNFSISSFLLTANFILSMSFFIQLSMQYFSPSIAAQASLTTFLLVILFTSFLLLRTIIFRALTSIFSLKELLVIYEFHFLKIMQTLGIAMLLVVLFMFAADKKYFVFAFAFMCLCILASVVLLIIRGLSTSLNSLVNHPKYFFIYVCVHEVAMVLLLIKLLTKIVS